jgi:magnesium chelatase subunit I
MELSERGYCFTAIVGQDDMKTALVLNAINPNLGGVLIRGEKGTAKSTAVRALAELLPPREQAAGCRFGCDPRDQARLCVECIEKQERGERLESVLLPMRVIDLPVSATEDRVVGTLDMEHAIKTGEKRFETGILARANRNILYVDEVNLLDDHVVDLLLDSAAMGVNTVEREGVSYTHSARFILVGTMNPEEGDLRPQLLDRFGLSVTVTGEGDTAARVAVMERRLQFENNPEAFFAEYEPKQEELRERIQNARRIQEAQRSRGAHLSRGEAAYSRSILERIAAICIKLDVDGHRADIGMLKTAMALAAFNGRTEVCEEDLRRAARLVLPHRMRRRPFEDTGLTLEDLEKL